MVFVFPKEGTPVVTKVVKRAGPYLIGPTLGSSPVKSIVQCLARKDATDDFYSIKILTLRDSSEESKDDLQGKMLLHTEYSLLSLLHDQDGVIHHHGFFKDCALEERQLADGSLVYTGRVKHRLCLVLDCLCAHDFNSHNDNLLNLQHYVIQEKKLAEREALLIFYNTVRVVESLHKRNIVHRDLKLGNLVLNRHNRSVTITNFCLGKHLSSEKDLLKDQRGSPAYISPDVLCGKPYLGKPSDMWALGVVLFTMLFGQFPFYDSVPSQLFNKIRVAAYTIPLCERVSDNTVSLIRQLLVLEPHTRLTSSQVLDVLSVIIASTTVLTDPSEPLQVVPDIDEMKLKKSDQKFNDEEELKKDTETNTDSFLHQITLQEQIDQVLQMKHTSPALLQPRRIGQIPVHKIDQDAREVTPAELARFQHLLPRGLSSGTQHVDTPVNSTMQDTSSNIRPPSLNQHGSRDTPTTLPPRHVPALLRPCVLQQGENTSQPVALMARNILGPSSSLQQQNNTSCGQIQHCNTVNDDSPRCHKTTEPKIFLPGNVQMVSQPPSISILNVRKHLISHLQLMRPSCTNRQVAICSNMNDRTVDSQHKHITHPKNIHTVTDTNIIHGGLLPLKHIAFAAPTLTPTSVDLSASVVQSSQNGRDIQHEKNPSQDNKIARTRDVSNSEKCNEDAATNLGTKSSIHESGLKKTHQLKSLLSLCEDTSPTSRGQVARITYTGKRSPAVPSWLNQVPHKLRGRLFRLKGTLVHSDVSPQDNNAQGPPTNSCEQSKQ
uniref:Serine/threonine-protein kinase 40 n=1 Tax=Timema californicum TaxID=61474 RepID=A0A7R9IYP3_TIMCA|nr:unnamed protein product [Timema californicum]